MEEFVKFVGNWSESNKVDINDIFEFTEDENGLLCNVAVDFANDFEEKYPNESLEDTLNAFIKLTIAEAEKSH